MSALRSKSEGMMNKKIFLTLVLLVLLVLNGCNLLKSSDGAENVVGTMARMSVDLTMQAQEIETLKKALENQAVVPSPEPCPTSACPSIIPCPTCPAPVTEPTAVPTPTLKAGTASLSGKLIYPSDHIPPQRVVAFEVNTGYYYWVRTGDGSSSYKLENLPAGTYVVMAYVNMGGHVLDAGYSVYAKCNLTCEQDHSLVRVELKDGEHLTGIDPIDWYAPVGVDWPAEPKN